jgi:hypothetical protein
VKFLVLGGRGLDAWRLYPHNEAQLLERFEKGAEAIVAHFCGLLFDV